VVEDAFARFWQELIARPGGPLAMRFVLQPGVAAFLALRDGRADAKTGRPAYFWAVITDPEHRHQLVSSGWHSLAKLLCMALALDLIYQAIVLHALRPLEAVAIAIILGVLPYLLLRGPINRISRALHSRHPHQTASRPRHGNLPQQSP
jgi:hypothetical protein